MSHIPKNGTGMAGVAGVRGEKVKVITEFILSLKLGAKNILLWLIEMRVFFFSWCVKLVDAKYESRRIKPYMDTT